ncbi:MAG: NUDIX domain-containing protein [Candidatus Rokuibacteriota bacterium]
MTGSIELIARAVIVAGGHLLLVRTKGYTNTYLPGGHVEFGERAEAALVRELGEELGVAATLGHFLGAVEHAWDDAAGAHHELNLVFTAALPGVSTPAPVPPRESHLEVLWQPLDRLTEQRLLPEVFCTILPEWIARGVQAGRAGWVSTLRSGRVTPP